MSNGDLPVPAETTPTEPVSMVGETLSAPTAESPTALAPEAATAPAVAASPVAESSVTEPPVATGESTPTANPSADAAPADAEPRRRVQLNPSVAPQHLRAIPTYGAPAAVVPVQFSEANAATGEPGATVVDAPMQAFLEPPTGPVSLPPKNAPLDAGLEAELAAAMSGALAAAPVAASAAGTPSTAAAAVIPASEDQLEVGTRLKAKVQSVSPENVFCEVGFNGVVYRAPGMLPIKQFPQGKHPQVGEEFLVVVDKFDSENGVILVSLPKATRRPKGNWEELAVGQIVECVVNKTNKGGLEVTVSNMRAFLPASQVDFGFVQGLEGYVGQRFAVKITEVNPAKRNLVVSRRAVLVEERKELSAAFWQKCEVGQQYSGKVKTIKDYGAFIDLGGVDGFLHVGEMSWSRIKHPSDVLQEGLAVEVVILSLDREKQKIGLGMRQLAHNPWAAAVDTYAVGKTVSGKVSRVTEFGAFIELEPGVEGLIHISELDHRRVKRVDEVLKVGQEVQAQVLEIQPERQRISLSLKALKAKPEEPKDEDLAPGKGQQYERKRKEPLRGGTGSPGFGGLFGNPNDFR